MQSLGERKKERNRVFSEDESNRYKQKQGQRMNKKNTQKGGNFLRRRDEKNGHTLLLELTTKEIARSEGSRVCKQGRSQGGTRLSVCGLQAKQTCTMDKHGAAEI